MDRMRSTSERSAGTGGKIEVPLKQRRNHAEVRIRTFEQRPDRFDHVRPMGVDAQVLAPLAMARDVDVYGAFAGQSIQERFRVVAEIDAVDVDVVDVEQQIAIRLIDHRVDKLQLAHLLARSGIAGDVLDSYAPFQDLLGPLDASGHVFHGLRGEWNRHEVIQMALIATVTQVLRVAAHVERIKKRLDVVEQVGIER